LDGEAVTDVLNQLEYTILLALFDEARFAAPTRQVSIGTRSQSQIGFLTTIEHPVAIPIANTTAFDGEHRSILEPRSRREAARAMAMQRRC
jgi:hypothetical protein